MSLINTGRGLQKSAYAGFGTVAQLEAKREAEYEAMLAAKDAQEKGTLGTFGGVGASYGVKSALDATAATKDALGALNTSLKGAGTVGTKAGGLTYTPAATAGVEAATLTGAEAASAIETAALAADAAAATTAGTTAATTQAATATTAAAASSPLATLSTIAAPLAIGVGLAYLLNELF